MDGLKERLIAEEERLKQIIQKTKESLREAPEGRLRVSKSKTRVQFYQSLGDNASRKYIAKRKTELIQSLAQKQYDEKVLKKTERRLTQIQRVLCEYEDDEIEQIYFQINSECKEYIKPVEPIWEQRVKEWKKCQYQGKGFPEGMPVIMTEKGERVRSKAEKIIADFFWRNDVEYKYECPLYLQGVGMVYPDFTLLSQKRNGEVYWEHCGKMDDPAYARAFVKKINAYENNGIYVGERLILTYETENYVLNTSKISQLLKRYILR